MSRMRLGVVIVGFAAVLAATASWAWLFNGTSDVDSPRDSRLLTISTSGPWPRLVIDTTEFEFGTVDLGETRTQKFTIRNQGEAPLLLKKSSTICSCTISSLEDGEIAPGATKEFTLLWEPRMQMDN